MLTERSNAKYRALLKRAISRTTTELGYTPTQLEIMRQIWRELPTPSLHITNRVFGDALKNAKGQEMTHTDTLKKMVETEGLANVLAYLSNVCDENSMDNYQGKSLKWHRASIVVSNTASECENLGL